MDYGNLKVPENVTPEVQAILDSYEARNKEIENAHRKNTGRIWLGSALSGASAHPVFNIPYIGTGLGGALYELGQGITEGDKLPELAKRTGAGFAIGETVGAIPYAGKYANKLSGGKIGNAFTAGVEKLASTPLGQKVTEIAPKVEDLLMTDIKAYNPFKQTQTAWHGSPYKFDKFSNEAIGTGEGAQAHGYGHYAAKSKDTAQAYAKNLSEGNKIIEYKGVPYKSVDEFKPNEYNYKLLADVKNDGLEATRRGLQEERQWALGKLEKTQDKGWWQDYLQEIDRKENLLNDLNPDLLSDITPDTGNLYKLSIPKDDVMLREDLPFSEQPLKVQEGLKAISDKYLPKYFFNNMQDQIDYNKSGKSIYNAILGDIQSLNPDVINHNNRGQFAGKLLDDYGIKGISYNGGLDGEARVIFNPNDIEIVRKYYNQPSLGEMLLKKSPNAGATSNYLYDLMIRE